MSPPMDQLLPDALFVVACPVCQGQVAAQVDLGGHDACCPLCASLFTVPFPDAAAKGPPDAAADPPPPPSTAAAADEPTALAEDWDPVITQLAPPRQESPPAERPEEPDIIPVVEAAFTEVEPPPATPAAALPPEASSEPPAEPVVAPPLTPEPIAAAAPADERNESLPQVGGAPVEARSEELVFAEPVRTIRQGDRVIEIRRLSPEERRSRRFRRNLMMIVVGISILLAIVLLFGFPAK
jgi:hypothetical protein